MLIKESLNKCNFNYKRTNWSRWIKSKDKRNVILKNWELNNKENIIKFWICMLRKVRLEMKWLLTKNSNNSKKTKLKSLPKSEMCIMSKTMNLKLKKNPKRKRLRFSSLEKIILMIILNVRLWPPLTSLLINARISLRMELPKKVTLILVNLILLTPSIYVELVVDLMSESLMMMNKLNVQLLALWIWKILRIQLHKIMSLHLDLLKNCTPKRPKRNRREITIEDSIEEDDLFIYII